MNVFKKITMFILLVCMTFSFAACTGCTNGGGGGGGNNGGGDNPPIETPDVPTQPSQSVDLSAIVGVYQPATLEGENKNIRDRIYNEIADIIATALDKVYNNGLQHISVKTDSASLNKPYKYNRTYNFNVGGLQDAYKTKDAIKNKIITDFLESEKVYSTKFGLFDDEITELFNFVKENIIGTEKFNTDHEITKTLTGNLKGDILISSETIKTTANKDGSQIDENGYIDKSISEDTSDVAEVILSETYTIIDSDYNYSASGEPSGFVYLTEQLKDPATGRVKTFYNYDAVLSNIQNDVEKYLKDRSNIPGGASDISSSGFLTAPIVEVEVFNVGYYEIEGGFEDLGIPDAPKLKVPYLYNDNYSTKDFGDDNTNKYVLPERNWLTLYFCTSSSSQNNFWLLGIDAIIKKDEGELSDAIKNCDVSITSKTSITSFDYASTKYKTNITEFKPINIDELGDDVDDETKEQIEAENKKYEGTYQFEINCFNKEVESNRAPELGLTKKDAVLDNQGYRSQIKFERSGLGYKLVSRADNLSNTLAINFNSDANLSFKIERISFSFMYQNPDDLDFSNQG